MTLALVVLVAAYALGVLILAAVMADYGRGQRVEAARLLRAAQRERSRELGRGTSDG